ncbi:hypothetical protein Lal_00026810 [Lupinus albus]|nr:hypothetical protein Lal_00026810 [Lupinus albus]
MSLAVLFGKLHEHELNLSQLEKYRELQKKRKTISLKARLDNYTEKYNVENMNLFVKKFSMFLRKYKAVKSGQVKKEE